MGAESVLDADKFAKKAKEEAERLARETAANVKSEVESKARTAKEWGFGDIVDKIMNAIFGIIKVITDALGITEPEQKIAANTPPPTSAPPAQGDQKTQEAAAQTAAQAAAKAAEGAARSGAAPAPTSDQTPPAPPPGAKPKAEQRTVG